MATSDETFVDAQSGGAAMDVSGGGGLGGRGRGHGDGDDGDGDQQGLARRAGSGGEEILWDGTKVALQQELGALPMERRMQQCVAGGFGFKAVDVFDERAARAEQTAVVAAAAAEAEGHDVARAVQEAVMAATPTPEEMHQGHQ